MESQEIIRMLNDRQGVKKEMEALMIELIASHIMSGDYEPPIKHKPINIMYNRLEAAANRLLVDFHDRVKTDGLDGNRKNYKITEGLAKLKIEVDLLCRVFARQNIESSYKQELTREFNLMRPKMQGSQDGCSYDEASTLLQDLMNEVKWSGELKNK